MSAASILNCFQDLISIKGGCDDVVPSSGIYLDDIGLSLNNLDEFVTKDYADSYDLFKKKRDFAIKLISNQVNQHLSDRYLNTTLIDSQRLGFPQDNLIPISNITGKRKGLNIEFWNFDSYVDLFVSEISVQINYTGPVNIEVWDLISGKQIDTIPITAVPGQICSVYPNKTYPSNRKKLNLIFVIAKIGNETLFDSYTTQIYPNYSTGNCVGCGGVGSVFRNSWLWAKGCSIADASAKIKTNLESSSDTNGISINYSLVCNHREWLCGLSGSIAIPVAYKTAELLMDFCDDVSTGERANTFVFANGDKISQRTNKYLRKYSTEMDNFLQGIRLPNDSNCFQCNSRTLNKVILP